MFRGKSQTLQRKSKLHLSGAILVLILSVLSEAAVAKEVVCQKGISPANPRQTTTKMAGNLPLDTPITVLYKGSTYIIKLGYILSWGVPESPENPNGLKLDKPNKFSELAFSFWMPNLRYQEVNELSYRSYRPCENGRPAPEAGSGKYIVKARVMDIPVGDRPITPELIYKRRFDSDKLKKKHENHYGLTKVIRIDYPLPFYDYYFRLNDTQQAYIECTQSGRDVPNPMCLGKFYYPDTQNYMEISFPPDVLSEWEAILLSAQRLPKKWRMLDAGTANH